jgi:hypothetical protein
MPVGLLDAGVIRFLELERRIPPIFLCKHQNLCGLGILSGELAGLGEGRWAEKGESEDG